MISESQVTVALNALLNGLTVVELNLRARRVVHRKRWRPSEKALAIMEWEAAIHEAASRHLVILNFRPELIT